MRCYVTSSGRWVGTQAEANRLYRDDDEGGWLAVDVPTDKPGLLDFLNKHGVMAGALRRDDTPAEVAPAASYADQAVHFEDAFEAMPLVLKLHFAGLAMEAARDAIGGRGW